MVLGWTPRGSARHSARVLFFIALLSGWIAGAPSWAGVVQDVHVRGNRIEVIFDAPVAQASAFMLAAPQRIALDIRGATPGGRTRADGPVAAIRQGVQPDGARIVLDLARPAIVTTGRFGASGRTLTLELRSVDDRRFNRAASGQRITIGAAGQPHAGTRGHDYSVSMPLPANPGRGPLPRILGDPSRPLVVIDAGHGGHDPGALAPDGRLREKDVTLQLARAIRDRLLESGRVRVALTREDDRFLVLQERYGIARRLKADLFISIHCDSASSEEASGATIYTLSEVASDKEAARLATRENKADILAGVDLGQQSADISSILIDLTQRETMNMSANFARLLGREAQPLIPIKSNYHRMASLMVLKAPDLPSVLFETGYISNPADATLLASREGQRRVAEAVRRAVEVHFATRMAAR